jgi:hypothetical protein
MRHRSRCTAEEQAIRDTAARESWPYNDTRANYEFATRARTARAYARDRNADPPWPTVIDHPVARLSARLGKWTMNHTYRSVA